MSDTLLPQVTTIPADTLPTILNSISERFKQGQRLVEFLSNHPRSITVHANQACSVGNLSDVAHKVNPTLYRFGYMIGCERPPFQIRNKFEEPSHMYLWSVYAIKSIPAVFIA